MSRFAPGPRQSRIRILIERQRLCITGSILDPNSVARSKLLISISQLNPDLNENNGDPQHAIEALHYLAVLTDGSCH